MSLDQSRRYYDAFSDHYETHRHRGYHRWLDTRTVSLLATMARGKQVLEVGCGTGLLLKDIAPIAAEATGLDLSPGMLEVARRRALNVVEGSADALPFDNESFDLVYSFKVLAHVPNLRLALSEMARVTRPGGHLVWEFYNRHSLRHLIRRLRPQGKIGGSMTEKDVYTRFHSLPELRKMLPCGIQIRAIEGLRVATLLPQQFHIPGWSVVENLLSQSPLRRAAGFLILVLDKT